MKEVDQAREEIRAIELSADERVKCSIKQLLTSLQPEDFPTELSDKGILRCFTYGYEAGSPLLATPQGLFHARLRNWGLVRESSIVITDSLSEASPQLYHQYSGRLLEEVEKIVEAKRGLRTETAFV